MSLESVFRMLDRYGTNVAVTRVDPPGPSFTATVRAVFRRATEMPLAGDVSQQRSTFYIRKPPLAVSGFPLPPVKGDRIVSADGRVRVVETVEPLHTEHGVVGAYRLLVRGH